MLMMINYNKSVKYKQNQNGISLTTNRKLQLNFKMSR